jgi:nicotinate-nucleotide adenylyltransferase
MKKIAIIGLAGNPPTIGHVSMGEYLIKNNYCDEVWYMPSYEHMFAKKLVDSKHRLKMLETALRNNDKLKVFDFEIRNKSDGKMFNTVNKLYQEYSNKEYNFKIVIGLDNANIIDKWYRYKELKELINFIVIKRNGVDIKSTWFLKEPHTYIDNDFLKEEISSTMVRDLLTKKDTLKNKESLSRLLDNEVYKYIIKNNLYNK